MEMLINNLLSPIVLAFFIGAIATLLKSDLEFPEPVLNAISIYLVFSIAIKGGVELSSSHFLHIWKPSLATLSLTLLIPAAVFYLARRLLKLNIEDAAGLAALYGSVSSVTFLAAMTLANRQMTPPEPFMPVMVSIMEWGILVALFLARWSLQTEKKTTADFSIKDIILETLRGRSVILMLGGLTIGYLIGEEGMAPIKIVYEDAFRGILVLYLLEMGMVAARQISAFVQLGIKIIAFAIFLPILHGLLGVSIGTWAGLSLGGSFVLGAIAASASYIDAPAAVRHALPSANPSIYLNASLGITFPFNLLIGLPLYYKFAAWLHQS
ncbi:MAG: sodium-dependent bicarbonate transport family permease [Methylacidiphilales bacterium]|nr:sodium-dependent bicarbonate transport family permease [Candidatus Methylacidiphilales bacterium]